MTNINPVDNYIAMAVDYLVKRFNIPKDQAQAFVMQEVAKQQIDPTVRYYYRKDNGDKEERTTTLTQYLDSIEQDGDIVVPSLTSYLPTTKMVSCHSEYMLHNTIERAKAKKLLFKYKQEGNKTLASRYDNLQKKLKTKNNSLSGAYLSKNTILRNPSGHYTLTSITRCVSSIGNAVTESLIYGNKLFKTSDVVLNYIVAIVSSLNKKKVQECLDKYYLYVPTPADVLESLQYSTQWYVGLYPDHYRSIKAYLSSLDPIELAGILYTNDLFHLRKHNDSMVREMVSKLIQSKDDLESDFSKIEVPERLEKLAKNICCKDILGMHIQYRELVGKPLGYKLVSTMIHLQDVWSTYQPLFESFFLTPIFPPKIAYIKELYRDGIVLSDTDSTCCSYDEWVKWYYGHHDFSYTGVPIASALSAIVETVVDQKLQLFSKAMGVARDKLNILKMKNEYYWSTFIAANTNKHYFANILIQEGNVYKHPELELKGVHFIASTANKEIVQKIHQMILDINSTLLNNKKIEIIEYIDKVRELEIEIYNKSKAGDVNIYKKEKIKDRSAYTSEVNPYFHYLLWNAVFGEKYGESPKPIYQAIKIPTTLDTEKRLRDFLDTLEPTLQKNFRLILTKHKKKVLKTLYLPMSIVATTGIPIELAGMINFRRIILDNLTSAYLVLQTLGFYLKDEQLIIDL